MARYQGDLVLIPAGNIGHRRPTQDLQHRLIPLLHNTQLHQHDDLLRTLEEGWNQKVSPTNRSHSVHHEPKPHTVRSLRPD